MLVPCHKAATHVASSGCYHTRTCTAIIAQCAQGDISGRVSILCSDMVTSACGASTTGRQATNRLQSNRRKAWQRPAVHLRSTSVPGMPNILGICWQCTGSVLCRVQYAFLQPAHSLWQVTCQVTEQSTSPFHLTLSSSTVQR